MSIESTLEKVEQEIREGKLGIARDRLQGLVNSYPGDLELRSRLGDVCLKLGYPRQAGKWWFLDRNLTEEKQDAIAQFVAECKGDELEILRRLKLRRLPDEEFARKRLQDLIDKGRAKGLAMQDIPMVPVPNGSEYRKYTWACAFVVSLAVLLMVIGFVTVVTRLFGWD